MKTIKGPSTGYSSDGESSYSNADLLQFLMRTRAGIDATSTENDQNATTSNKIKADEMIALKQEKTQGAFSITKTFLPFSIVAKHDLSSEFRKFELKSTLMPPPSPPLKKNKKRAPESRSRSGPRSTSLSVSINNSIKSYVNFLPVGPIGSTLDKKNRNVEYTKISNNSPFNSSVSVSFSDASRFDYTNIPRLERLNSLPDERIFFSLFVLY